jgi:regulator of sigma E protease
VWRRMAIVAAGPIANYLFAAVLFTGVFVVHGKDVALPVIGEVVEGSAAYEAGLRPGDKIVSLNGTVIDAFEDIREFVQINLDQEIAIQFERDGALQTVQVQPTIIVEKDLFGKDVRLGRLGIGAANKSVPVEMGILESGVQGVKRTFEISAGMLEGLWQMVTGVRPAAEIGSVLRIGYMSGEIAQVGILPFIVFTAMLSVNLGLVNLFPVPLLDGGHLTFYAIEAARGKPLGLRTQEWGFRLGIAFVLGLMLFATWNDLVYFDLINLSNW